MSASTCVGYITPPASKAWTIIIGENASVTVWRYFDEIPNILRNSTCEGRNSGSGSGSDAWALADDEEEEPEEGDAVEVSEEASEEELVNRRYCL